MSEGLAAQTRLLIVDDSPSVRRIVEFVLRGDQGIEVVGEAGDGVQAIEMARSLKPNAILLDVEMPVMDGLTALPQLRSILPDAHIILFSDADSTSDRINQVLHVGGAEFVPKPKQVRDAEDAITRLRRTLLPHLQPKAIGRPVSDSNSLRKRLTPATAARIDALLIGSSTGGPLALEAVLSALPRELPVPVFIVQHINEEFSGRLANRLAEASPLNVVEGTRGLIPQPGTVYIAPGGSHMELSKPNKTVRIKLTNRPPVHSCRPSVDVLFNSAASAYGAHQLGLVLTGMGYDGLDGSRAIAYRGAPVLVQDEATSIIWGMPGAIAEADLADEILPLNEIAGRLERWVASSRKPKIGAPSGV
jgi:two-component system, chemotaxis family, protein-glutamate methylesterase/glutaminase